MPEEERDRALAYAYRLLSYRQRSERELAMRLGKKGFGGETVKETVKRLRDSGYLDDGAFALTLRRRAEEEKLLGSAGAKGYLRRMGIPEDAAEEALAGYDEVVPARKLVRKKLGSMRGVPEAVASRRLAGCLKRRGYSTGTVMKSLRNKTAEIIEEE